MAIHQIIDRWRQWQGEALRSGAIFAEPSKSDEHRINLDTVLAVSQRLQTVVRAQPELLLLNHPIEITYSASSTPAPRRSLRTSVATFLDVTFRTRGRKAFWLPLAWAALMLIALLIYRAVWK